VNETRLSAPAHGAADPAYCRAIASDTEQPSKPLGSEYRACLDAAAFCVCAGRVELCADPSSRSPQRYRTTHGGAVRPVRLRKTYAENEGTVP
jgi:hypothetical protein